MQNKVKLSTTGDIYNTKTLKNKRRKGFTYMDDCPRCGSYLIARRERFSQNRFIACTTFPKCYFTAPEEQVQ